MIVPQPIQFWSSKILRDIKLIIRNKLSEFIGWSFIIWAIYFLVKNYFCSATDAPLNILEPGILVAIGAQFILHSSSVRDAKETRSRFYLECCVFAYEEASNLLLDGNNNRAKWVHAGRALLHAKEIAKKITEDAHLRSLELHRLKYRGIFSNILTKEAAFFYGAEDPTIDLNEAAKLSTREGKVGGVNFVSTANEIPLEALRAVWGAAQWPNNYKELLGKRFSKKEEGKVFNFHFGLYKFLTHKERYSSACGKLYDKSMGKEVL